MKALMNLTFVFTLVFLGACSQQNRSADPGIGEEQLLERLNILTTQRLSGSQQAQVFNELVNNPQSSIYFSENSESLGPVASVLSFFDLSFLARDLFIDDIENVQIFFVDLIDAQGRENALLVDLILNDGQTLTRVYSQSQDAIIEDDEYIVEMSGENGSTLQLRTFDLKDGSLDFEPVIQLKVDLLNSSTGEWEANGQFSTLVGFGG